MRAGWQFGVSPEARDWRGLWGAVAHCRRLGALWDTVGNWKHFVGLVALQQARGHADNWRALWE